jgi:hypothetical protein
MCRHMDSVRAVFPVIVSRRGALTQRSRFHSNTAAMLAALASSVTLMTIHVCIVNGAV